MTEATKQESTAAVDGPLQPLVRVPWPENLAPLRITLKCPICGAGLLLDAGEGCELDSNGEWIASEVSLSCETEPNIDSEDWDDWQSYHYHQPYTDWLPLEMKVLRIVQKRYYFPEPE